MIRASAAVFILLLAVALSHGDWLQPLDRMLLDAQSRALRAHFLRPVASDVTIVGIDEETAQVLREPITLWHGHLGRFLEAAAAAGAAAVGLDVVLPDRSYEAIVPGYDRQLLTGILIARRTVSLVLALTVDPAGQRRPIYPAFVAAAGPDATGYALLPIDSDGVVRRFDERIGADGSELPTLAGQMARRLGREPRHGLMDYTSGNAFGYIKFQDVLSWHAAGDKDKLQSALRGKVILLGSTLKYEDRLAAPVNLVAWDPQAANAPGVLLHAQALRNLLNEGTLQPVAAWIPLALALAAALLWLCAPSPGSALALLAAVCAICIAASTLALAQGRVLPVASVMLVALIAVGGRQLLQTALSLRERRRLRRSFSGYVSPTIMREILAGTLDPALGGVKQFACVLFSDIRGYTTRSEHMTPEQTIAFLNGYFERIVPIIHDHGGTVVSFMGDGIMAVFGAPQPLPNPCTAAFETTRAILENLRQLNADLKAKGEIPLEIGVGLHAGEGVAGHIGAATRHEYSVIGDVTNVASRLEGLTKEVGYHLVCSYAVADRLEDRAELVPLGARAIKGHSAVEIFGYDRIT